VVPVGYSRVPLSLLSFPLWNHRTIKLVTSCHCLQWREWANAGLSSFAGYGWKVWRLIDQLQLSIVAPKRHCHMNHHSTAFGCASSAVEAGYLNLEGIPGRPVNCQIHAWCYLRNAITCASSLENLAKLLSYVVQPANFRPDLNHDNKSTTALRHWTVRNGLQYIKFGRLCAIA
jgi:hypothetical protein